VIEFFEKGGEFSILEVFEISHQVIVSFSVLNGPLQTNEDFVDTEGGRPKRARDHEKKKKNAKSHGKRGAHTKLAEQPGFVVEKKTLPRRRCPWSERMGDGPQRYRRDRLSPWCAGAGANGLVTKRSLLYHEYFGVSVV
jgi:hypothetical protein